MYVPNGNMSDFVAEDLAQDPRFGLSKFPVQPDGGSFRRATAKSAGETLAEGDPNHGWKVQNGPCGSPFCDPLGNMSAQNWSSQQFAHP
jgi:hypothetical protein